MAVIVVMLWVSRRNGAGMGWARGVQAGVKAPTGWGDHQPPRGGVVQQAELTPGEKSPRDSGRPGGVGVGNQPGAQGLMEGRVGPWGGGNVMGGQRQAASEVFPRTHREFQFCAGSSEGQSMDP